MFKHHEYLYDLRRKGIDVNNKRRAARDPTVLTRGMIPMKGKEHRGVGDMQLRHDGYLLSHPAAQGRARQRAYLQGLGYSLDGNRGPSGCLSFNV